ncbi:MAG: hypothetical protein JSR20_06140 [Nitrospira sp.]|nr:hypothetical protein [Nitrospira sp.]
MDKAKPKEKTTKKTREEELNDAFDNGLIVGRMLNDEEVESRRKFDKELTRMYCLHYIGSAGFMTRLIYLFFPSSLKLL